MKYKLKSLDEHVEDFVMPFGKWKDVPLDEIPIDYLDWVSKSEIASDWHKKLINHYIAKRAIEITEKQLSDNIKKGIDSDKAEENRGQFTQWVDENF